MAITITGAKYTAASVSSVGTTTVTVSTTPFVSGDFVAARRVDLYDSSGTTFKGTAFVRSYVSTSQLQLETEFFDPKTGTTVTQVSGDLVYVSKNFADVVQAGIALSGNVVTVSDTITFGTSGTVNSLCFHDEGKTVVNTVVTDSAKQYNVAGGFLTFGHLQSYTEKSWYAQCNFLFNNTGGNGSNSFVPTSTAARLCVFGGIHKGSGAAPLYVASGYTFPGGVYGTDWGYFWCLNVVFDATDVMSKNAGGNWTTGSNHVLEACTYVGAAQYQILNRFANGSVLGGLFKITNNSAAPLSIFGVPPINGTYEFGALADDRMVVADIGQNDIIWCNTAITATYNFTNVISPNYRASVGAAASPVEGTNCTKNIYFKDTYTGLQDASGLTLIHDSSWSVDSLAVSSGANSSVALTAFHSTATGFGTHTSRGPWTYRIRKYGFDELEGTVSESSYSLGTAGTAFNVAFGGSANQVARSSLTGNASTALAIAGITVTDHGASPVTWNSKQWSITITVDLATYPARSLLEIFQHIKAGISQTSSWNGKVGLLWHVLMEESGGSYITQRGKSGGAGASLKGVRVVDQAGNALSGVTMTADDGTTYLLPSPAAVSATVLADTRVQLYNVTQATELDNVFVTGTAYSKTVTTASIGDVIRLRVCKLGYQPYETFGVWSGSDITLLTSQISDPIYAAWGIDGSNIPEFSGDVTGHIYIDANDLDGATTKTRLGAWYSWVLTTEIGIRHFYGAVTYIAVNSIRINVEIADVLIENTNATTALRFTDTDVRLYRSNGTSVIAPTSYSIHNDYSGVPDVVETGVSGLTGAESAQLMGLPDAGANANAVWTAATRTLTSGGAGGGASADDVWNHSKALTVGKFLGLK